MPDPTPGPGPDDEQAVSPDGQRYLDWQALLDALAAGGLLDGDPDGQDAAGDGRVSAPLPAGQAGALAVEHMAPGPAQAGWLAAASAEARNLDEYGLAGVAIAARRLASWAQAAELATVAQLTARAAAADRRIGLAPDGRPARLCRDAVGQVSLALMLTDHAATDWADLAITLAWRLAETGEGAGRGDHRPGPGEGDRRGHQRAVRRRRPGRRSPGIARCRAADHGAAAGAAAPRGDRRRPRRR